MRRYYQEFNFPRISIFNKLRVKNRDNRKEGYFLIYNSYI